MGAAGEKIFVSTTGPGNLLTEFIRRELRRGALSAHSALLADLLDGGILKAAALIWLLGACGWGCLKLLLRESGRGLAIGMILGFTVLSNLVSNRYGLLYDRAFLLFYPLLLLKPEREES